MAKICLLLLLVAFAYAKSPPVFNYSYHVAFDQTVIRNKQEYHVKGQEFYEPSKNRERVDRENGQHNIFCGTILPNVATACQSLTVDGNRWIVFPQRSQCCLCCTSQHGCGILAPDWLKAADFQGEVTIDGTAFDKWHEKGSFSENYLYVTADAQPLARRLDEGGEQITDYNLATLEKTSFPDSVFALPTYCNAAKPTNCPLISTCGRLRQKQEKSLLTN